MRDTSFTSTCRPVYVFFDNKLIDQVATTGSGFDLHHLVIPGNATVGRHLLELSCTTNRPYLLSAPFDVTVTVNHLSEFSVAMPSPTQIKSNLVSSGGISIAVLPRQSSHRRRLPSEWLDVTYAENRERIQARARKRFPKLFINREVEKSFARRTTIGTMLFLGFILFAGLINSFLDKGFGLNRTTLWLFSVSAWVWPS